MRIAILEDDPDQLALLTRFLSDRGHELHGYLSGREIMRESARESFDLYLLDWQVPDVSGIDVLRWIREQVSKTVPVLFVTIRDTEENIVVALEAGAHDYMVKPVRKEELNARVTALLRRAYPATDKKLIAAPPFEIDLAKGEIRCRDARVELTPKEFELAATFFRNIGRLLSRGYLQETVWGRMNEFATRTLDTHVSKIRKKLALHPESGYRIVPVYNYGYRLERVSAD